MADNHQIDDAELARLGIRRVPSETFHWGDFRYAHIRDALAAARGAEKK